MQFLFLSRMALIMNLNADQENFVKLGKLIIEIIPKYLRTLFKAKWNAKFPAKPWTDDAKSGQELFNVIPPTAKNKKGDLNKVMYQAKILAGNCELWDPTILFYVLLYSGLKLTDKCRPKGYRVYPLNDGERVDRLREIRNEFYGHPESTSVASATFGNVSSEIKDIAKDVFGSVAENEVCMIINSKMTTAQYDTLSKKYQEEKSLDDKAKLMMVSEMQGIKSTNCIVWFILC